jgi:hypothetical protein
MTAKELLDQIETGLKDDLQSLSHALLARVRLYLKGHLPDDPTSSNKVKDE